MIEKVTVGKRGDGSLVRVEGQANWYSVICVRGTHHVDVVDGEQNEVQHGSGGRGPRRAVPGARGVPERVAMAVTGHVARSSFDHYNIVSDDELRMASQKTILYVDSLPTKRSVQS